MMFDRPVSQQGKGGIFSLESLPEKYRTWIEEHDSRNGAGLCHCMSEEMQKAFPELLLVRGYVLFCHHWWCETPDGTVVDPTYKQFHREATYRAYDESQPEPVGQCFECGTLLYEEGPYGLDWRGNGLCFDCSDYRHGSKNLDTIYYEEHKFEFDPEYERKIPDVRELAGTTS
jgi:hypothetical protein